MKFKSILFATSIVIVFAGLSVPECLADQYQFPPITREMSWDEKYEALTVPSDVLGEMSTADLVQTVMRFPLKSDFMVTEVPAQGLEYNVSRANCLQELESREDAGWELFLLLQDLDPIHYTIQNDVKQKVAEDIEVRFVALMLSRERVLLSMSPRQKSEILNYCAVTFENNVPASLVPESSFLAARLLHDLKLDTALGVDKDVQADYLSFVAGQSPYSPILAEVIRPLMAYPLPR